MGLYVNRDTALSFTTTGGLTVSDMIFVEFRVFILVLVLCLFLAPLLVALLPLSRVPLQRP